MYFKAAFNRGELLVCGGLSDAAEYELGAQGPAGGDLPLLGHGLVDDGVVVLQVGADVWGGGYFCTGMTGGKKRRKTLSGADLSEAGARKNLHQLLL